MISQLFETKTNHRYFVCLPSLASCHEECRYARLPIASAPEKPKSRRYLFVLANGTRLVTPRCLWADGYKYLRLWVSVSYFPILSCLSFQPMINLTEAHSPQKLISTPLKINYHSSIDDHVFEHQHQQNHYRRQQGTIPSSQET
jgi:hypothetical protein